MITGGRTTCNISEAFVAYAAKAAKESEFGTRSFAAPVLSVPTTTISTTTASTVAPLATATPATTTPTAPTDTSQPQRPPSTTTSSTSSSGTVRPTRSSTRLSATPSPTELDATATYYAPRLPIRPASFAEATPIRVGVPEFTPNEDGAATGNEGYVTAKGDGAVVPATSTTTPSAAATTTSPDDDIPCRFPTQQERQSMIPRSASTDVTAVSTLTGSAPAPAPAPRPRAVSTTSVVPVVVFTCQVATLAIGSDAFQEADVIDISRSCTKWNVVIQNVAEIPRRVNEAFKIATSGRPEPVLVDLPKDITASICKEPIPSPYTPTTSTSTNAKPSSSTPVLISA